MATLFISDLHLTHQRPAITELFLVFLSERAVSADALYILGDLFEYWIGDEALEFDSIRPVVFALRHLSDKGTPLYVMRGNRDVLLGADFEQACGCQILDDPTVINLNNEPTLVSHGDYLCTDDIEHQKFRKMIHDPQTQRDFLAKNIKEREAILNTYREISMARTAVKSPEIMDVNQHAVEQAMLEHDVRQMIHGHTHRPAIHKFILNDQSCKRIVLGDWYEQGSVLSCNQHGCELQGLPLAPE